MSCSRSTTIGVILTRFGIPKDIRRILYTMTKDDYNDRIMCIFPGCTYYTHNFGVIYRNCYNYTKYCWQHDKCPNKTPTCIPVLYSFYTLCDNCNGYGSIVLFKLKTYPAPRDKFLIWIIDESNMWSNKK